MSQQEVTNWAKEFDLDLEDESLLQDLMAELDGMHEVENPNEADSSSVPKKSGGQSGNLRAGKKNSLTQKNQKATQKSQPPTMAPTDPLFSEDELTELEDELRDLPGFKDL